MAAEPHCENISTEFFLGKNAKMPFGMVCRKKNK
jgi:hypothetical protein